ncbi:MAG: SRPBCC domain-containing protein [Chloroflexi bacterium]|nr:MAG: SRPBCC domain-containing protein [Chloroflexota bacterium]TMD72893.1 MAG: SRPBCC domain-containing protein [Chloroflexota bacterium]
MAGPLMHSVQIDADADKIYEALSTSKGLASFWTADSHAEPKVGTTARFGFHGPVLEMRVDELEPGKRVRWSTEDGFPEWKGTTVTWDIKPAKDGGQEVVFNHDGWPEAVPAAELASVNYSWGRVVGRLKKYAETGKPAPYFP